MVNKIVSLSLVSSLISFSCGTMASSPIANIKVTGSITPPTCQVNGGSEIDLEYKFTIDRNMFSENEKLKLTEMTKNLVVTCDASTYLSLVPIDQRQDSIYGGYSFGLGFFNGSKKEKIGSYEITMKNAKVKETESSPFKDAKIRIFSAVGDVIPLTTGTRVAWAQAGGGNNLQQGQVFSADFTVEPVLNPLFKSSWSDEYLDGHTVLAFSFSL